MPISYINIAILLPDLRCGGAERVNLDLAHVFKRKGYVVEFVLMQAKGGLLEEAQSQFLIHELGCSQFRQVPLYLARYLKKTQPDALLAAMWPLTGIAGVALRLAARGTRLVASEHTDLRHSPAIKNLERHLLHILGPWFYKPAHAVVGVSQGVCDSLVECARLDRHKLKVIYNPIRPIHTASVIKSDSEIMEWWQSGHKQLISVGSLIPAKDYPTLLKSLSILRLKVDARLLILGEGSERKNLERLVDELDLHHVVRMPGFRPDPYPYVKKANVFVLSSAWEGLGNVITEALACGTPVVSTDCPSGPAEILCHSKYGSLVPVGNAQALSDAITQALEQAHDKNLMMKRANEFIPEIVAKKYLSLLVE